MSRPNATLLSNGKRLHLHHGPIDLIIGVDADHHSAFEAAKLRFETVLDELVPELQLLRSQVSDQLPKGQIARKMHAATHPYASQFITPMAAVAGAVADEILHTICAATRQTRAYVNNGGDIALHLLAGQKFTLKIAAPTGQTFGHIAIPHDAKIAGIATSGQSGRSLSFGIADSVSVLASSAAIADAAATLIANAVNVPNHPNIQRCAANALHPDSDLGDKLVTTHVGALAKTEVKTALSAGKKKAQQLIHAGHITAAALFLRGQSALTDSPHFIQPTPSEAPEHA